MTVISNERFVLTNLGGRKWVVADTETNYSIVFRAGEFNTSQKVIPPDQQPDSQQEAARLGAYAMRCIGDYMAQHHPELVFPTDEQEQRRLHFTDTIADIGRSVRQLREYQGHTVEEASEASGFSVRRIENIEAGKLPADLNVITRIVERLGGRLAIVPEETPDDPHCQFIEFDE